MKRSSPVIISLAALLSGYLLSVPARAEPASIAPGNESALIGFYKGVIILSGHWDPIVAMGGGLVSHDRSVNDELQTKDLTGVSPLMAFGTQSISSTFFRQPTYRGTQTFTDLEFGVTSHFGLGLSWMETILSVTRQEQIPLPSSITPELDSSPYTEAAPVTRKFYRESVLLGDVFYHFLAERRVDPYVVLRLGGGTMETAYRTPNDYVERLASPYSSGYTYVVGAGIGINLYLTDAFGLKAELSGTKRYTHSTSYSQETLGTSLLSFGFFLNLDNIRRTSE
jgi:hypothetical protein